MDLVTSELKAIYSDGLKDVDGDLSLFAKTVARLVSYSMISRKEGMLKLEEYVADKGDFLSHMMMHIIDGDDADTVQSIAEKEYLSRYSYLDKSTRLSCLMEIVGCLHIQAGGNPYVLQDTLLAMTPLGTENYLDKMQTEVEKEMFPDPDVETATDFVQEEAKKLFEQDPAYGKDDLIIKMLSVAIEDMDDESLHGFISHVDLKHVAVSMKMLEGKANRAIISVLPDETARTVVQDCIFMGPVRMADVRDASRELLKMVVKLADSGDIICPEATAYDMLLKIFSEAEDVDDARKDEKRERKNQMLRALEDYIRDNS